MDRRFWEREVEDVTREYPDARLAQATIGRQLTCAWLLTMRPIPNEDELPAVLADLKRGEQVCVRKRGEIGHSPECSQPHHEVVLPRLRLSRRPYVVELTYPSSPTGDAGPLHPRAKVIDPEISHRTHPSHPHMYVGPGEESWACPMSPQSTAWRWRRGATVRYLDQVALWILKSAVWIATGGGILESATWLGPDTPHSPFDLLGSVRPGDPCWCGRGTAYEACHQRGDIERAIFLSVSRKEGRQPPLRPLCQPGVEVAGGFPLAR